jgi:LPXTG-site transpeptidase (sortase) family protein
MNYKLFIASIIGTFILSFCFVGLFVLGVMGKQYFNPEKKSQRIQVAPVAPLTTPVYTARQQVVSAPPGLIAAALEETTAAKTPTPNPSPTPGPTPILSPTPTPTIPANGSSNRLIIPKIALDRPVLFAPVENGTWQVGHLDQAVGYLEGTAPPGSNSNHVLAGHVTLDTGVYGPFARLNELVPGDMVIVYQGDLKFFYLVESQRTVTRNDVTVVYPSETGQITLITCTTWNSEEGRYSNRLVIKGRLIKGSS